MSPLFAYLNGVWLPRPFVWGEFDCCLAFCDWLVHNDRPHPLKRFEGKYVNGLECDQLTGCRSNPRQFIKLICGEMEKAGYTLTKEYEQGDVGLLRNEDMIVGGICTSEGRWACKTDRGVIIGYPVKIVKAWKLNG